MQNCFPSILLSLYEIMILHFIGKRFRDAWNLYNYVLPHSLMVDIKLKKDIEAA